MRSWGIRIVNLVHDSIIMEVPITPDGELRQRAARLVTSTMEQVPIDWGITRVPFKSDAEVGNTWGQLTKVNMDA